MMCKKKKIPAQSTVLLHSTIVNMCSSQLNSHWLNSWIFRTLGDLIRRQREPSNLLKEDFPVKLCFDLWYIYVHLSVWAHVHVYVRATHAHTRPHTHICTHILHTHIRKLVACTHIYEVLLLSGRCVTLSNLKDMYNHVHVYTSARVLLYKLISKYWEFLRARACRELFPIRGLTSSQNWKGKSKYYYCLLL